MNRIKEVLEEKGIKQTWLAEKLEKSYNMVNSYVQNRRQPSLKDLFRISRILGVKVEKLLSDEEIVPNRKIEKVVESVNLNESGEVYSSNETTTKVPLLGSVSCGLPIFAEENIEAHLSVSVNLIKKNYKYFLLSASGDSMNNAGINDGDLVLIRQQQTANNGEKVLALIDDEATIKVFQRFSDKIVLKPDSTNIEHKPIILTKDFSIQGIVETVIPI